MDTQSTHLGKRTDHCAREARTAIAARVRHIIVGLSMDDERRAVRIEQRARRLLRSEQSGVWKRDRLAENAVRRDVDVGQVAGVRAGGIVDAMLAARRVPVGAGTGKVRRIATPDGVNMIP